MQNTLNCWVDIFDLLQELICFAESSGNAVSDACAEFRVKYVGAIEKLQFDISKSLQEPLDLINYIDAAQVSMFSFIH